MTQVEHRSTRAAEPEVRTTAGIVRGRQEGDLAVFRGIPFAEPTVGEARFAAPRPARAWDGAREAFSFGPPPPQDSTALQAVAGNVRTPRPAPGDTWLTVNVWTPDPDPAARRPVMVWIYGGAYRFGSGGVDSRRIAHDGSVVVVTFNYREGVEGFAQMTGAPANRGLLDQIAALQWVQENVEAFGGDPDQVTIFGESAGAVFSRRCWRCRARQGCSARNRPELARLILHGRTGPRHRCRDRRRSGSEPNRGRPVQRGPVRTPRSRRRGGLDDPPARAPLGQAAFAKRVFAPVVDGELVPTTVCTFTVPINRNVMLVAESANAALRPTVVPASHFA